MTNLTLPLIWEFYRELEAFEKTGRVHFVKMNPALSDLKTNLDKYDLGVKCNCERLNNMWHDICGVSSNL